MSAPQTAKTAPYDPTKDLYGLIPTVCQHILHLPGKVTLFQRLFIDLLISRTLGLSRRPGSPPPKYACLSVKEVADFCHSSEVYASTMISDMEEAGITGSISPKEARAAKYKADGKQSKNRWYCLCPENWEKAPTVEERQKQRAERKKPEVEQAVQQDMRPLLLRAGKHRNFSLPEPASAIRLEASSDFRVERRYEPGLVTLAIEARPAKEKVGPAAAAKSRTKGEAQQRSTLTKRAREISDRAADAGCNLDHESASRADSALQSGSVDDLMFVLRNELKKCFKNRKQFQPHWIVGLAKSVAERTRAASAAERRRRNPGGGS